MKMWGCEADCALKRGVEGFPWVYQPQKLSRLWVSEKETGAPDSEVTDDSLGILLPRFPKRWI